MQSYFSRQNVRVLYFSKSLKKHMDIISTETYYPSSNSYYQSHSKQITYKNARFESDTKIDRFIKYFKPDVLKDIVMNKNKPKDQKFQETAENTPNALKSTDE